ncbi:hypothetical protein SAMN04244579_02419 [Azotobacter beijerinckii]|uniref:Uncharacterized protein n=1 Tax=Azotobacter beijerinckii TaxID=170623 RepID=A0A1H6USV5_9GAMM|nr:hypothetical protein [Azotobacter beijerinckii]SEI91115.1 hypothetical protein SAMN04244579_02419 [Azotobacter beijerinckii]
MQDEDEPSRLQQRTRTQSPHATLAWLLAGNSIGIDAMNAYDWRRHIEALVTLATRELNAMPHEEAAA